MEHEQTIAAFLDQLYAAHRDELGQFPWEHEGDRWNELIVCLWIGALQIDPLQARDGIGRLANVGLDRPSRWTGAKPPELTTYVRALVYSGWDSEPAESAIAVAHATATQVEAHYSGNIQTLLRAAGLKLADELALSLKATKIDHGLLLKSATMWLQNVANMPLLTSDDSHISAFCERFGVTFEQLLALCDKLMLNVAVFDDLIAAHVQTRDYLVEMSADPMQTDPTRAETSPAG